MRILSGICISVVVVVWYSMVEGGTTIVCGNGQKIGWDVGMGSV